MLGYTDARLNVIQLSLPLAKNGTHEQSSPGVSLGSSYGSTIASQLFSRNVVNNLNILKIMLIRCMMIIEQM